MTRIAAAALLGVMGLVWVIQGFGLAATGSFMDGNSFWGWAGLVSLAAAAGIGVTAQRRRRR